MKDIDKKKTYIKSGDGTLESGLIIFKNFPSFQKPTQQLPTADDKDYKL